MAEKRKKPTAGEVGAGKASDLSARLEAASGNIERVSADTVARQTEQKKNLKKSASDARARVRGSEKQLAADNRRRNEEAAKRLAELEYAEDYRKKLQRDRRRAMAEAKEAREAAEAKAREERAQQIAEILEKERREARERSERAEALLMKLARSRATETAETSEEVPAIETVESIEEVEEVKPAESTEAFEIVTVETAPVSDEAEINLAKAENTVIAENTVSEESEEAAPPAAESYPETEITVNEEPSCETEKILIGITDDRMLLNIGPDGSFYRIDEPAANANTLNAKAEEKYEEVKEEVVGEYPDPNLSSHPVVAGIQTLGKGVYSTSTYRKYVDRSGAAIKEFKKICATAAQNASIGSTDEGAAGAAMVESIIAAGHIVEIRCDNLRLAARFGQKNVGKIADSLHKDIERYNSAVAEFTAYTGERLTRIPTTLPKRIADGTGVEVIPELSYTSRYIEYKGEYRGERTRSYVITVSSGDEDPNVTRERSKGTEGTYIVDPVVPAVTAEKLLVSAYVYDESSYKNYRRVAKSAGRDIERAIKAASSGIDIAERENNKLAGRLEYHRKAIEKAIDNMNLKINEAKDVMFRKTLAVLEGKRAKYEKDDKKRELYRSYAEDEGRKRHITLSCFALRREKLILAFNTLSASTLADNLKYVEEAKAELLAEMGLYNKAAEDCSAVIGIPVSLVTADLAEEIIQGKTCVDIPRIAILRELVETVGDKTRAVGKCESTTDGANCTFVIKGQQPEDGEKTVIGAAKPRSGIKTVHGHFFIGGTAYNGGAENGAAGYADALVTGAMIAGPMLAAGGADGADPGAAAATALAFGTAAKAAGFPGVMGTAADGDSNFSATKSGVDAEPAVAVQPEEAVQMPEAAPAAENIVPAVVTEAAPTVRAVPLSEVTPMAKAIPVTNAPVSKATPEVKESAASDGSEFAFTPGVYGFDDEPSADAIPAVEEIQPASDIISDKAFTADSFVEPKSAPKFDIEKVEDSPVEISEVEEPVADVAEVTEEIADGAPALDAAEEISHAADLSEPVEAPIEDVSPRKLIKTVRDGNGKESVIESPYTEELVDDGTGVDDYTNGSLAEEMYSGPMPIDMTDGGEPVNDDKLKLVQLPPPERAEGVDGIGGVEQGALPADEFGPVYPGNVIEHSDSDKFVDPDDLSSLPPVVEIDDSTDVGEGDILTNPTKRGLKKHLSYLSRKIRKAEHERSRLIRLKRREKSVVPKVKYIISILGVQKEIIDWYCNALSAAVDVGVKGKIRRIASELRIELKRYNRFVKEYERITDDRLTRASLDVPASIIEGEDYQIIPKVKLREFEAPENGIVYDDGITEIADVDTDFSDNLITTEKELSRRLQNSSREIKRLRSEIDIKNREKRTAMGIDKTVLVAECFGIQKKIIDMLAADLHAACQVSSIKDIQSIKKELVYEIRQYNRLVGEYKAATGNNLTPASEDIPQQIISGGIYTPVARVGCVHNSDDELDAEIRSMSRNTYGVEDDDIGEAGRASFRANVIAQANKDLTYVTRRADYQVSMLESERDMLDYRFGKESSQVRREKKNLTKIIEKIKAEHKVALRYESSDNRRYYAVVTANPRTMFLCNKRTDRTKVAALRSRIISLLNERDMINGKLMALYGGEGVGTLGSINQTFRRVKNNAAAKSKKKQKGLAKTVKALPITVKDKERFYELMNKKVDAESTLAFVKYRIKKGELHKADMLCAKRDIKELKTRIGRIDKDIKELMKSVKKRIAEVESGATWMVAFVLMLILIAAGVALYIHFFGDSIIQMLNSLSA